MHVSAREFFEAARDAARDAERIGTQLAEQEERALALGGGGLGEHVSTTPAHDRMAARVAALVDHKAILERRRAEDYRIIDRACAVLYGTDNDAGLWALVGWPADAIYHHYLALRTWEETGALLGYSHRYVQDRVAWAFELADANGMWWTERGHGMAEA
jgi:hypothetical protein